MGKLELRLWWASVGQTAPDQDHVDVLVPCLLSLFKLILPQVLDLEAVTASLCPPFQHGLSVPFWILAL